MKPITVSVVVDRPREEVFAHLDMLANHEAFTDHFMHDFTFSGPAAGVGRPVHGAFQPGAEGLDVGVRTVRDQHRP
jgi:hypothetical protein